MISTPKPGKRIFDIFVILIFSFFLIPLFLIIYLLTLFFMGRPVIFSQDRPGINSKLFTLYKFRTMANLQGCKLESDNFRLTKFGLFLRSTSLDEIPEFYNVLIGDMSLVGPRPLLSEYLPLYSDEQMKRHEVLPGITGLAQISGRNTLLWEDKFKYDVKYIEKNSLLLDFKILLITVKNVVIKKDFKDTGEAMKFQGSSSNTENKAPHVKAK
jgi:lipopolysaccharide/colanic/teichoic acid biosynthesis glycosyltransferase